MSSDASDPPQAGTKPQTDAEWTALVEALQGRIGATVRSDDRVTAGPAERLAATLDLEPPPLADGAELPTGWHCLYCLPAQRLGELNVDGLPLGSEPIPNIPLSRRVFGGATLTFAGALRFGDNVSCETSLTRLVFKSSRSGPLVIATVERRYSTGRGLAVVESQDIIHMDLREGGSPPPPAPFQRRGTFMQRVVPTPALLFRFSALTFNTHRIHYDTPYAVEAEGQPALLVQGRLLAELSLGLVRRSAPGKNIVNFAFRSSLPIFSDAPFEVCAEPVEGGFDTWVVNGSGQCAQTGKAMLRTRDTVG